MEASIGLEFAPGTTEDSQKLVTDLYPPEVILSAYKTACVDKQSRDIVLVGSDNSPDLHGGTRAEYVEHLRRMFGLRSMAFRMCHESAHSITKLPADTDAMWLVVQTKKAPMPIMCVLYAIPYVAEAIDAN